MEPLDELQERLGYRFCDIRLLQLALTHPSVSQEQPSPTCNNQRLEFLGDSVLGLILSHALYARFGELGEGPLTQARAYLVNRRALAKQARRLDLGRHLVLSKGEEASGGRERTSSLADAFEAVLGAVFLDGGYEAARQVVLSLFAEALNELEAVSAHDNPKGELQELLQAASQTAPRYELTAVSGPDHDRVFECAVYHEGQELGRGVGKSKKAAESEAARRALERLRQPHKTTPGSKDSPDCPAI